MSAFSRLLQHGASRSRRRILAIAIKTCRPDLQFSPQCNNFLQAGLTNYAATYATGLLLARRVLQKFNLDKTYTGTEEASGEDYNVEATDDGPRPFTALLDTGLKRTSTGSKVFAALKVLLHSLHPSLPPPAPSPPRFPPSISAEANRQLGLTMRFFWKHA